MGWIPLLNPRRSSLIFYIKQENKNKSVSTEIGHSDSAISYLLNRVMTSSPVCPKICPSFPFHHLQALWNFTMSSGCDAHRCCGHCSEHIFSHPESSTNSQGDHMILHFLVFLSLYNPIPFRVAKVGNPETSYQEQLLTFPIFCTYPQVLNDGQISEHEV